MYTLRGQTTVRCNRGINTPPRNSSPIHEQSRRHPYRHHKIIGPRRTFFAAYHTTTKSSSALYSVRAFSVLIRAGAIFRAIGAKNSKNQLKTLQVFFCFFLLRFDRRLRNHTCHTRSVHVYVSFSQGWEGGIHWLPPNERTPPTPVAQLRTSLDYVLIANQFKTHSSPAHAGSSCFFFQNNSTYKYSRL